MNAEVVALLPPLDGFVEDRGRSSSDGRAELRMTSFQQDPPTPEPALQNSNLRESFDAALIEHHDELLQYLRKRLRDREAAADLAQETCSRMLKYRDAAHIEDRRLMLFRIANNLILEHHRTRQRRQAAGHVSLEDIGPLREHAPSVEAIVDARQAVDTLLRQTIVGLPPKCRLAFMLSRFDELSYPQIAERMGVSVKMVEKHITKALLACRAAVGRQDF